MNKRYKYQQLFLDMSMLIYQNKKVFITYNYMYPYAIWFYIRYSSHAFILCIVRFHDSFIFFMGLLDLAPVEFLLIDQTEKLTN